MKILQIFQILAGLVIVLSGFAQAADMSVSITPNPVPEDTYAAININTSADIFWVYVYRNGYPWFNFAGDGAYTYDTYWSRRGVYEVLVQGLDKEGAVVAQESVLVAVYNPDSGFVTGAGSIDSPPGAYVEDPSLTGRAQFAFVSKYTKGATVPTGHTEFMFKAGDLNFQSNSYDWLVINQGGINAQFKGSGAINGEGDYKFMIRARDDESDTFSIVIWQEQGDDEIIAYDNSESGQLINSGNIIVHQGNNVCSGGCGQVDCDCEPPCIPPCDGSGGGV